MSGLFSSVKKAKAPAFVAPPVTDDTEAVKEAALRESERLRKRKGFASTIVTGPNEEHPWLIQISSKRS